HSDCNGDGVINASDTLPIYLNYLLTHSFKSSATAASGDINLVTAQVLEGVWNKADVVLGSSGSPVNQVYGIAFDIDFDNSLIEVNSSYLVYTSSFLNASGQNIQFKKSDQANGKVYAASVRTNGNAVNGDGKIGEFWFKVKSGIPAN